MNVLTYVAMGPYPKTDRSQPRIWNRTVASVFALRTEGYMDVVFGMENVVREPHHYANLVSKHNHARELVLQGGYDALFLVEADMVVPPDALERLLAVPADVAYGLYVSRHSHRQWLSFLKLDENTGISVSYDRDNAWEMWGQVIPTEGCGFGCTLIHRRVLEQVTFRWDGGGPADDWLFSLDCKRLGFTQMHDMGLICGHCAMEPSPRILWPDLACDDLVRVEFLG